MARLQPPSAARSSDVAVGVCWDAVMELHMRDGHPEHPERTRELVSLLRQHDLLARCHKLPSRAATDEEIHRVHRPEYAERVEQLYNNPPWTPDDAPVKQDGDCLIITSDIYCNKYTAIAARTAAGCAVEAVQQVLQGNVQRAFAVVRPPGHHAGADNYSGFCFYNNVSVAAQAALAHPGIERVLILDWDVHHGNGTQAIFYNNPNVLTISLHRRDRNFYPEGAGYVEEVGAGPGAGFNINIGWTKKGVGDLDYVAAFEMLVEPVLTSWQPQLVLVAAGFDAVEGDPLGGCCVSAAGYAWMTSRLLQYAGGKVVAVLEGGYNPRLVSECAAAVVSTMLGDPAPALEGVGQQQLHDCTYHTLSRVEEVHQEHWRCLRNRKPFKDRLNTLAATLCIGYMQLRGRTGSSPSPAATAATATPMTPAAAFAAAKARAASARPQGEVRLTRGAKAAAVVAGSPAPELVSLPDTATTRKSSKVSPAAGQHPAGSAATAASAGTSKSKARDHQAVSAAPVGSSRAAASGSRDDPARAGNSAPFQVSGQEPSGPVASPPVASLPTMSSSTATAAAAAAAAAQRAGTGSGMVPAESRGTSLAGSGRSGTLQAAAAAAEAEAGSWPSTQAPKARRSSTSATSSPVTSFAGGWGQLGQVSSGDSAAAASSPSFAGSPAAAAKARSGSTFALPSAAVQPPPSRFSPQPNQQQVGTEEGSSCMLRGSTPSSEEDMRPAKSPRPRSSPSKGPHSSSNAKRSSGILLASDSTWPLRRHLHASSSAEVEMEECEEVVAAIRPVAQHEQQPAGRSALQLMKSMSLDPPESLGAAAMASDLQAIQAHGGQ